MVRRCHNTQSVFRLNYVSRGFVHVCVAITCYRRWQQTWSNFFGAHRGRARSVSERYFKQCQSLCVSNWHFAVMRSYYSQRSGPESSKYDVQSPLLHLLHIEWLNADAKFGLNWSERVGSSILLFISFVVAFHWNWLAFRVCFFFKQLNML